MKEYTEEMRMSNEYPEVGQSVILNLLVEHEGLKKYNGSELLVVDITPSGLPLFHCRGYGFYVSLNNAHFKAVPPKGAETETPEEASEFDRIEMVNRVNNEAEDWPQVGDEVECGGCYGVVMGIDDNMLWVLKGSSMYDTYHIGSVKRPKTPEQILTGKVESLIADSLKESNFTGDIGLGDIASIITSNLELYFKVSDL